MLKNYNSDIYAMNKPPKQLIPITNQNVQMTSEESPTAGQPYFGSASYHLTSRYGQNVTKPVEQQQVQSCHVNEENFYIK